MGQSEVVGRIALEWGISMEEALENIRLRATMRSAIVKKARSNAGLLEARAVRDANNAFWVLLEEEKNETGAPDYDAVGKKWMKWYRDYAK